MSETKIWFFGQAGRFVKESDHLAELSALRLKLEAAEKDAARMRESFHVNMIRAYPEKSHEEISAAIDEALRTLQKDGK